MGSIRILLIYLLTTSIACTRDRATEDSPAETFASVRQREEVFNAAYEELDGALLARLLHDDYRIDYGGRLPTRDADAFLRDLVDRRGLFPDLDVRIDSSRLERRGDTVVVTGERTFGWMLEGQAGQYRERYVNRWLPQEGQWRLYRSDIEMLR